MGVVLNAADVSVWWSEPSEHATAYDNWSPYRSRCFRVGAPVNT